MKQYTCCQSPGVVHDQARGIEVCTNCGRVHRQKIIAQVAEYNLFGPENEHLKHYTRVNENGEMPEMVYDGIKMFAA